MKKLAVEAIHNATPAMVTTAGKMLAFNPTFSFAMIQKLSERERDR